MKKNLIVSHYDENYFSKYQKEIGEFGGIANLFKFNKHINNDDAVLDFGCGGGFLLKQLNCKVKMGVEVNDVARDYCKNINKINCFESIDEVDDNSLDVIISNHCLEHTLSPIDYIQKMYSKLKINGKIILVVPLDSYNYKWRPKDVNNHLYSFSPMNLGNLLQGAGFKQINTDLVLHKWPPFYKAIHAALGETLFHVICRFYGIINRRWVQVKGFAIK